MRGLPINARDRKEATVTYRAVLVFIVFALGLPDAMRADQHARRSPAQPTRRVRHVVAGRDVQGAPGHT